MTSTAHLEIQALSDRLVTEYAGAIAPGQVEVVVRQQARGLAHLHDVSSAERLRACELAARRALTDRLAVLGRAGIPAGRTVETS